MNAHGDTIGVTSFPPSNEARTEFLVRVLDKVESPVATQVVESVLGSLGELWKRGSADREDLVRLLDLLRKRGLKLDAPPFVAARQCLLTRGEAIGHFRAAADFCRAYPEAVSRVERDALKSQFAEFAAEYPDGWQDDDPDLLRQLAADLEYVSEALEVESDRFTQDLYERADELERERAEEEPPDDYEGQWAGSDAPVDDVQGMFDGLLNDLREG